MVSFGILIFLCRMEEYRAKIESLEIEKTRLQDLLNRSEKVFSTVNLVF